MIAFNRRRGRWTIRLTHISIEKTQRSNLRRRSAAFLMASAMLLVAGLLMWVVSSLTRKPSASTLARYFRTA